MLSAALPSNEAARLAYLRSLDLLDTPPEQDFDDVALLASQICQTPIALVSLVEAERQWFKAKVGVDVEFCGSSRDTGFCSHAILRSDLMIVEDAFLDERFRDNPFVANPPHVRFYAGMPLTTSSGFGLGTLCVIDSVPRQLTQGQRKALQILGRQLTLQIQMRHASKHDALTGLSNRAHFMELLQRRIDNARREPEKLFAAMCIELEQINEGADAAFGDATLAHIADRVNGCLRTSDIVVRPDTPQDGEAATVQVAHLSGAEFTILLDRVRKPVDAARVAARVLSALDLPIISEGREINFSACIGVVVSGGVRAYEKAGELLHDASVALTRAKEIGAGQYALFNAPMHHAAVARLQLESELLGAVERGEFLLNYQPIICLKTGRIHAFEALIRWRRDGKIVGPADFLPAAEDIGVTPAICRWVLTSAIRQLGDWRDDYPELPKFKIALNLTRKQLAEPQLLRCLETATADAGVEICDVQLEITENSIVENSPSARRLSKELRAGGVQMSMDDFGNGRASITSLHQFPINSMKIDWSFVNGLPQALDKSAALTSITALAHSMKISVVAEAIETQEQARYMQSLNFDFGQGYFFARPLTADGVHRYLAGVVDQIAA